MAIPRSYAATPPISAKSQHMLLRLSISRCVGNSQFPHFVGCHVVPSAVLANFGRSPPRFARLRPSSTQIGAEIGQPRPDVDQHWPEIGKMWPDIGKTRPSRALLDLLPNLARRRPSLTRSLPTSARIGLDTTKFGHRVGKMLTSRIIIAIAPNSWQKTLFADKSNIAISLNLNLGRLRQTLARNR